MIRIVRRAGVLLFLVGICLAFLAASRPQPSLHVAPSLKATDMFVWWFPVVVNNSLAVGLYNDSLVCEVEDLGPGETRAARKQRFLLPVARALPSISAGDSGQINYRSTAIVERARLTFRLHAHDSQGRKHLLTAVVEAMPGPTSKRFPSTFIESQGRKVECVLVSPPWPKPPSPGVLLVHGHASHARYLLDVAWQLANKNYYVMLVSQPGYGLSEGPADLMGPATVDALERALDRLRRTPGVDSSHVGAWGISRGATAVALLAERRSDLRAVVVQSGIYDLWATYRATRVKGFRETIVKEAGRDSAAWRLRSPGIEAERIKSAVLVMHGENDVNVPADQARTFAASLGRGTTVETRFFPGADHMLTAAQTQPVALDFLTRLLKEVPKPPAPATSP